MRLIQKNPSSEAVARRVIATLSTLAEVWSYSLRHETPALVVNFAADRLTTERLTRIMQGLDEAAKAVVERKES